MYLSKAANDAENGFPYFAHGKVVLVTANARLGIFGFAALDALRSRDTASNSTGNYGMQDQRAVLQWVQANIESFGGTRHEACLHYVFFSYDFFF